MRDHAQRVLIIVARPEDEAYVFGATISTIVQRGTELIVLSCRNSAVAADTATLADVAVLAGGNPAPHSAPVLPGDGVAEILGIRSHHILRADNAQQLMNLSADELASDVVATIASVKPDVVVSYAQELSGAINPSEALLVHEAVMLATEELAVPLYTVSAVAVDRSVEVSSATALAFKREAIDFLGDGPLMAKSASTPVEYVRRVHRRELLMGERSRGERVLLGFIALILGAIVGLVLTAVHQSVAVIAGTSIPWGVVFAVAIAAALIVGLRLIYDTRVAAGCASLGMLMMAGLLASVVPGGTVLIPANVPGYVWTFAPALIVLVVVGWPRLNHQLYSASRDTIE